MTKSAFRRKNIFQLSTEVHGRFDVSMSFGTAEHFFEDDRQTVFDVHAKALKPGDVFSYGFQTVSGLFFTPALSCDEVRGDMRLM